MIKAALFDIDGALTDGTVIINSRDEESKTISFDDIDALFELKRRGIKIGFITGENDQFTEYVRRRFTLDFFITGCKGKLSAFKELVKEASLDEAEFCYPGDSVKDAELLKFIGNNFVPNDVDKEVKTAAKNVLRAHRGKEAIKEVARYILELK